MPHEAIVQSDEVAAGALLVAGVHSDVRDEKIEQPVAVVIEEHGAGRVPYVAHSCILGDVAKVPAARVLEQAIAVTDGSDEKIRIAIVIDVRKGAADRDCVGNCKTGLSSDVSEPAAA